MRPEYGTVGMNGLSNIHLPIIQNRSEVRVGGISQYPLLSIQSSQIGREGENINQYPPLSIQLSDVEWWRERERGGCGGWGEGRVGRGGCCRGGWAVVGGEGWH